MHLHILGIGGTFMSALALLAREDGHKVTGSDANCYPPVSSLLSAKDIEWSEGYEDASVALKADCVIVGNAMKRGMPVIEAILNKNKHYTSGPQWLAENLLSRYKVLAIAGTHGKTTTTTMCAYILEQAGKDPAFLIGGVAPDFNTSARLGRGEWFVIEADEYDSAFFDKRPKFIHYRPEIAILNNLEFDHADIYPDLSAIAQQFHYLLRTIPSKGIVIKPRDDKALNEVLSKGVYCPVEECAFSDKSDWRAEILDEQEQSFRVWYQQKVVAEVHWSLLGRFNIENGLAAIAACFHAGVEPKIAARALETFTPVKRRLELKSKTNGVSIYDDFAHHPTAIQKTIEALKKSKRHQRIFVVLEFASYTMKTGVHADKMGQALAAADGVFLLQPEHFNLDKSAEKWPVPCQLFQNVESIIGSVTKQVSCGDAILVMSNRGFENIHQRLEQALAEIYP